jgi:hypothetical protein
MAMLGGGQQVAEIAEVHRVSRTVLIVLTYRVQWHEGVSLIIACPYLDAR